MTPEAYEELLRLRSETDWPGANPFKLPTSDTAILAKGEVDRRRKQLERQLFSGLRVHEKTTATTARGGASKSRGPGKDGTQATAVVKVAETIDPRAAEPRSDFGHTEDEPG